MPVADEAMSIEHVEGMLRFDAREALRRCQQVLEGMSATPDTVTYQRWLLIKGAAQARLGDTEDGARIMREVRVWADAHGEQPLLASSHRRLSELFRRVGDPALMLEHAVTAVNLLHDDADARIQADHLLGLADALGASGSYDESIARYREAARLADGCDDPFLRLAVRNNLAFTQYQAGLTKEAVATAERLLAEATADGRPLLRHYGDTIASTYMAVGRFEDAANVLEPLCGQVESGEDCDGVVLALLTLTAVRRQQGRFEAAHESLVRAERLIGQYALTGLGIELMREQAELHAAEGRFQEAYERFREFHRAERELLAVERDARARTLNAIFEATEARRRSDHFRELSVRDPLTGLHNRRHMDSVLAEFLDEVRDNDAQLTVGLVDLDHFKRVNDTRSHAVGDEVLRLVAGIIQQEADRVENGLAVRMGGEEFLVLLPNVDRATGVKLLDQVRAEIEAFAWDDVTDGVPVTASIGVAAAPEDDVDRKGLLETADRNLYCAKRNGRNQVV